ncbi:MAG: tyrosine decarboxylase MfnA, partial [Nitrososphaerales archaeon]
MQEEGLGEEEVFAALEKMLRKDATYRSGKILASMCSEPLELAKKVYTSALEKNLGDEFLFPGTVEVERETVSMLGSLLSNSDISGHIVSGGSEANITALWVA